MSKAIILYNFANYYNRKIFRLGTFEDYQALITPANENTPAQYKGLLREDFNFDFNDGVVASKVLNIKENEDIFYAMEHPNYMVIETSFNAGTVEDPSIVKRLTRWYILECKQIMGKQFRLSLRRDLLADKWDEVMQAPVFIERGNPAIDDPAIFNREGFTYNEIKRDEFLLNNTKLSGKGRGWVVGYLARYDETDESHPHQDYSINATGKQSLPPPDTLDNFTQLPGELQTLLTVGTGYQTLDKFYMDFSYENQNDDFMGTGPTLKMSIEQVGNTGSGISAIGTASGSPSSKGYIFVAYKNSIKAKYSEDQLRERFLRFFKSASIGSGLRYDINAWYNSLNLTNRFTYDYWAQYNNKIIIKDNKFYKIIIKKSSESTQNVSFTKSQVSSGSNSIAFVFKDFMENLVYPTLYKAFCPNPHTASNEVVVRFRKAEVKTTFQLLSIDFDEISVDITTQRKQNLDAPYDLFCIPIGPVNVYNNNSLQLTARENSALAIARAIANTGTTALVYDIQVLPYCPYPDMINSDGDIDITGYDIHEDYEYVKRPIGQTTENINIVLFPLHCRGTFDLDIPENSDIYEKMLSEQISAEEKKIKAETENARFVSPNFASLFDINIQKNNGISRINVDYFLKPYSPYIHVAPYFSGLYGEDFNDPKGLICSGEFSISTAQSQWELYQIQNKNYELIFNRQIENLDVNNAIAYEQAEVSGTINAISNTASNMFSGALAGGVIGAGAGSSGGPYGAIIGAAVGGVAGAGMGAGMGFWGLQKDLELLSRSQQEARSFAKDMYTYNLGNVKALPQSLTKVSSLTENNKIFPFIEFYDCTEEEREALRNKIKYNGMTVMRIGKIQDFIDGDRNYVQGQLIRLDGINEDSHVVSEIANEIKQGAYYYGSNTSES